MAISPNMNTSRDVLKYRIEITQNAQNIAGNSSNVTVKVFVWRTNTGYTTYGPGTCYCTINGTAYSDAITASQKITNAGVYVFSRTVDIPHNADGTKTLKCSAYITHSQFTSTAQEFSTPLTTIPRASSMTVPAFTLGTAGTIKITAAATSFTHTVTWKFGTKSGTVATKSTSTSLSWTPALTLAAEIPNAVSGTGTITCQTYSGNTLIGTTSKTFTAAVPGSVTPTCTLSVSDGAGKSTTYGGYIQGVSTFKITVTGTPNQGSAIAAYSVSANGASYNTASVTTGVLTTAGSNTIKATVTDKRGRSGSATQNITVLAYAAPQITSLHVNRCNADGAANDTGEYCKLSFSGSITALSGKNTVKWNLKYRQAGSSAAYTSVQLSTAAAPKDVSKVFAASSSYSYEIILEGTDAFKTTAKSTTLSTGSVIMHYRASGKGMGIGKVGEAENELDVGWAIRARNGVIGNVTGNVSGTAANVTGTVALNHGGTGSTTAAGALTNLGVQDYVTAQGSSGIWRYRKWKNGYTELWGFTSVSCGVMTGVGNGFYSPIAYVTLPFALKSVYMTGTASELCSIANVDNGSPGTRIGFRMTRHGKLPDNTSVPVMLYVWGELA